MTETEIAKKTLGECLKACSEAIKVLESQEVVLGALKKQKDGLETSILNAREEYRKVVAINEDFKNDLEARKKSENAEILKKQEAATKYLKDAEIASNKAFEAAEKATKDRERAATLLAEAEESKKYWESKKESIRAFLQSGQ